MAIDTAVNGQITDSVTQVNTKVLGESPTTSYSNLLQSMSLTMAQSSQNLVANQQRLNSIETSATTQGINVLYSIDTASIAAGTSDISNGTLPSDLYTLGSIVQALKRQ